MTNSQLSFREIDSLALAYRSRLPTRKTSRLHRVGKNLLGKQTDKSYLLKDVHHDTLLNETDVILQREDHWIRALLEAVALKIDGLKVLLKPQRQAVYVP